MSAPKRVQVNPFAGDLESMSSPRKGERCMICGQVEPGSHAIVRLGDNLHWGVVCASHTLRQVVLSGLIDVELRVGERFLDKPPIPTLALGKQR